MPTIGQGLMMLGGGIGNTLARRHERKKWERLAELLAGAVKPGPTGKAVSELAPLLAGVGQAMPIPEHMGGNALPFSTPQFTPQQQAQLRTPAGAAEQNAATAPMRAMLTSGIPQVQEMALGQLMGGAEERVRPPVPSSGGAWVFNPKTGTYEFQRTESQKTEVHEYVPGRTYEVTRPNGQMERITIPGEKDYEWKDILDPEATAKAGFEVAYLHRHLKGSDEPWENTGLMTQYNKPGAGVTVNTGDMPAGTRKEIWSAKTDLSITRKNLLHTYGKWNPEWSFKEVQGLEWGKGIVDRSKFLTALSKMALGPERHRQMMDEFQAYTDWSRSTQDTLNRHIRAFTGAQMNQYEIPRLLSAMATQKDGPERYSAKIKSTIAMLDSMEEEYNRLLDSDDFKEGRLTLLEIQDIMARNIEAGLQQIQGPLPAEGTGIERSW